MWIQCIVRQFEALPSNEQDRHNVHMKPQKDANDLPCNVGEEGLEVLESGPHVPVYISFNS